MKVPIIISIAVASGALLGTSGNHIVRTLREKTAPVPVLTQSISAPDRIPQTVTNIITRTVTNSVAGEAVQLESLQWEVQELGKLLAARNAELDRIQQEREAAEKARTARQQSWRERAEQRRKEDPEGYAEQQKQREAYREKMTDVVTDKTQFLKELDTSRMTAEELDSHNELVLRVEETWSVIQSLQQGERPSREARSKLRENFSVLNELYTTERDYVLREVGMSLGYSDNESVEFSTYMKEIFELTSPRPPQSMMRMGHPGAGQR